MSSESPYLKHFLAAGVAVLLTIFAVRADAVAPVEAVALFKERAVVRTSEGEAMLKVGETSDFGVTLLAANPHGAQVRYKGELFDLALSVKVGSRFTKPTVATVRMNEDSLGQYRMRGAINGNFVNFLVDTGASVVALSERDALRMGLNYRRAQKGSVQTAQGIANAYFLSLDTVTIGGITINGVQATVIEGDFPTDVLLGMSFLNKVKMQNDDGVLVLTAK